MGPQVAGHNRGIGYQVQNRDRVGAGVCKSDHIEGTQYSTLYMHDILIFKVYLNFKDTGYLYKDLLATVLLSIDL